MVTDSAVPVDFEYQYRQEDWIVWKWDSTKCNIWIRYGIKPKSLSRISYQL